MKKKQAKTFEGHPVYVEDKMGWIAKYESVIDIDLLEEFITWAQENSKDAWWIYEHTEEAISLFLKQREEPHP